MANFNEWCTWSEIRMNGHSLHVLSCDPNRLSTGIAAVAGIVPTHYAAGLRIASIFERLGKSEAAKFLETKLPTNRAIRSGDLGEILASEIIATQSSYEVPIRRLRWKDHRNMAMRGEDVIGILRDPNTGALNFLKAEAKSRVTLNASVITEARAGLDKDGGMPSAHALSFIADRLSEMGNELLANAITDVQLKHGIEVQCVQHLLFILCGNSPEVHLSNCLKDYAGGIAQWCVGLRIDGHAAFVAAVYDMVIANACG